MELSTGLMRKNLLAEMVSDEALIANLLLIGRLMQVQLSLSV